MNISLKKIKLLSVTIFIFCFLAPNTLFAQINYEPLAPLPGTGDNGGTVVNNIGSYLPGIFTLAIEVAAALAVIMITIGGIEYIGSESVGSKQDGTKKIQNALIGLLLAIGAWVILNTINPNLVSFDLSINSYRPPDSLGTSTPPGLNSCNITSQCVGNACLAQCPVGSGWPDDSFWRFQLTSAGVVVTGTLSPTQCTLVNQTGCTSVYNLPPQAISGILWLKSNCAGCSVTVTGGTEFWPHVSHGPGTPRVDLRLDTNLDAFIRDPANGTDLGGTNTCFPGQPAWSVHGATYVLENGNHWHVCY